MEKPKRTLTALDLRLGIGLTDEYRAEVARRLAPVYAPIVRRILAEQQGKPSPLPIRQSK